MPTITVIIPTYKPGSYIYDCLGSIAKQTISHSSLELIIVLNGCNEPYKTDLQDYIKKNLNDICTRLVQTDIPGVSNARNMALDISTGDYVCFIDDDDFISEVYLEELLSHSSSNVIPVCKPLSFYDGEENYFDYNITKDYNKLNHLNRVPFYKAKRFFNGPVYKIIHKDIIGDRRFDIRFKNGEDSLFMFLISDRIKYVEFTSPKAIYYRRIRKNSATQSKKTFGYGLRNYSQLMLIQTVIFFRNIPKYNLQFYLQSLVGRIKSILLD